MEATKNELWDALVPTDPRASVSAILSWFSQVQDTSFILCIVVIQPEVPVRQLKNLNTVPSSKLLYHRLDLLGQPSACLHFKQLATLGRQHPNPPTQL